MKNCIEPNITKDRLTADEAIDALINHLLGENWYVADPVDHSRVLAIAVNEIKRKYPKRRKVRLRFVIEECTPR